MAASRPPLLARTKIISIPKQIAICDLKENDKLLSDLEIKHIIDAQSVLTVGRNKWRDLRGNYDIIFLNDEFFAIYFGATSERELGCGAYGIVKLAQNLLSGEFVAFKVIDKSIDRALKREIPLLKKTGQLIGYYLRKVTRTNDETGMDEEVKQLEILMKLAPGLSLTHYVKSDTILSPIEYLEIMETLLESCDSLLEKGIVHRDIKDENIIFHLIGHVLTLVDYGLAVLFNQIHGYASTNGAGSEYYQAPEIKRDANGEAKSAFYGEVTEIYAIAMTIRRLLNVPFNESTSQFYIAAPVVNSKYPAFSQKIPSASTQASIFKLLNSMSSYISIDRSSIPSCIKEVKNIKAQLNEQSKVITIGFVDLMTFDALSTLQKDNMFKWLKNMHRVCFLDGEGNRPAHYYLITQREFEEKGLIVLDEVVRYRLQDRAFEMPCAAASYLKSLYNAQRRCYLGYFILPENELSSSALLSQVTRNGLLYVGMNHAIISREKLTFNGVKVTTNISYLCSSLFKGECKRLQDKMPTDKRRKKITALQYAYHDIDVALVKDTKLKQGMFKNIIYKLKREISPCKEKSKTLAELQRISRFATQPCSEEEVNQALESLRPSPLKS